MPAILGGILVIWAFAGDSLEKIRTYQEALDAIEKSPLRFTGSWDDLKKETR